jgi:hypothetical protein
LKKELVGQECEKATGVGNSEKRFKNEKRAGEPGGERK